VGAGPPIENLNAAGSHSAGAGPPIENLNAAGSHSAGAGGACADAGAPIENLNAAGAGASLGNRNAAGIHRPATEKAAQVAYDKKIGELQKSANCAQDPFDVPILDADLSKALKAIAAELKAATRIVACAVCDNFKKESDTQLLVTTMDQPPPDSWMAPLQATVSTIQIEGSPDPQSLERQYRVPALRGISPAWNKLLLSPRGIYEVTSPADTTVPDGLVYPTSSYADLHVDTQLTHTSFAKACVCDTCTKSLKRDKKPQFACANDLCIGNSFPSDYFFYTFIFRFHFVHIWFGFTQILTTSTFADSYVITHYAQYEY
jgi:hypothetical protein